MIRGLWIAAIGAVAVAGSACGSSSTSSGSGEENKTADQIFSDAISGFGAQQVVHLVTASKDSTGTTQSDATITQNTGRATLTDPSGTVTILIVTGGAAYASVGSSGFQTLSGDLLTQVSSITVKQTASCAGKEHGALTKGSISTVNGKRVIAIVDDGKTPGASPGTIFIALDGTTLPVRAEQTAPTTPGGSLACGHSPQSKTTSQTIDFDYPSGSVTITPPAS
jgi:hypothetical protein